jgi:hypothetical protein
MTSRCKRQDVSICTWMMLRADAGVNEGRNQAALHVAFPHVCLSVCSNTQSGTASPGDEIHICLDPQHMDSMLSHVSTTFNMAPDASYISSISQPDEVHGLPSCYKYRPMAVSHCSHGMVDQVQYVVHTEGGRSEACKVNIIATCASEHSNSCSGITAYI